MDEQTESFVVLISKGPMQQAVQPGYTLHLGSEYDANSPSSLSSLWDTKVRHWLKSSVAIHGIAGDCMQALGKSGCGVGWADVGQRQCRMVGEASGVPGGNSAPQTVSHIAELRGVRRATAVPHSASESLSRRSCGRFTYKQCGACPVDRHAHKRYCAA